MAKQVKKAAEKLAKPVNEFKRFLALTDAQKDAEVAEFENGVDRSQFRPLNAEQRKQWARIKRKIGRPTVGLGAKIVPISIERGLLKEADLFAKRHKLKRSQMVADGLRLIMAKA